jgi:3-hydroxyacyl-CoA dehydrogenase / enoyl-CoA hydratase / 3-hydroxybutyryl-CoA epimerase
MPGRSMNVLNEELTAVRRRDPEDRGDAAIKGLVITSGKKEFSPAPTSTRSTPSPTRAEAFAMARPTRPLLRRLETCGKPVVAALNGHRARRRARDRAGLPLPRRHRRPEG